MIRRRILSESFLIILAAFLLLPGTVAIAHPAGQESKPNLNGTWNIAVKSLGGVMCKGRYVQIDLRTGKEISKGDINNKMGASDLPLYSVVLTSSAGAVNGTYEVIDKNWPKKQEGVDYSGWEDAFINKMKVGTASGSINGDKFSLEFTGLLTLTGAISGENIQGEGVWKAWGYDKGPDDFLKCPDSPATFQGSRVPGTGGVDCSAEIILPNDLQPGNTLSPAASFTDPDGKETVPIQQRWLINGKETPSVVWDGSQAHVELEYTCSNHQPYTKTADLAAFVAPPVEPGPANPITPPQNQNLPANPPASNPAQPVDQPPAQPVEQSPAQPVDQPPVSKPASSFPGNVDPTTVVIAVAAAGAAAAAAGLGGFALINVVRNLKPTVAPRVLPTAPHAPPQPRAVVRPPAPAPRPVVVPSNPPPAQASEAPAPRMSGEEKARLQSLRSEIQVEIEHLLEKYQKPAKEKEALQRLYKKNILKFVMKKSLETKEWLTLNPIEIGNKLIDELVPDKLKLLDRLFQKHSTTKDPNIIMDIKNKVDIKNAEMHEIRKEVIHLKHMINDITRQLAGGG